MHLTEQCTRLSKTAIERLKALGQNVLLLCTSCVVLNSHDKLVEAAIKLQQVASVDDKRLKNLQTEVNEFKKAIFKMKELVIGNTSAQETVVHQLLNQRSLRHLL